MAMTADVRSTAMTVDTTTIERDLELHRRELTGFCYRMLGSGAEAEDAVQETYVRAWKAIDRFEGRSSLRSWLYRIAHNVCVSMAQGPQRRARPMDLGPSTTTEAPLAATTPEHHWITPIADSRVMPLDGDPAELAAARDTIRLAFVAALQHLPARQRAVLILREVLRWQATEVAELLDTTVASVNSALQRARATLDDVQAEAETTMPLDDARLQDLLGRYVEAFEAYDISSLVTLLREDVEFCMPPYPMWLQGPDEVATWMLGPGYKCEGSRLVPTTANGCPAFGQYRIDPNGGWAPWAFVVLEVHDGEIIGVTNFLDTANFAASGLPTHLD
jgi:RNA polymerase sigma-70 factor (ECF subfamily)